MTNKVRVILTVDKDLWEAVPSVARWLGLPSDALTTEVASQVFELLLGEAVMEATAGHTTTEMEDGVDKAVEELLDPNVSVPVTLKIMARLAGTGLTLAEMFDQYEKEDPNDIWIKMVLSKTEDPLLWRMALASTYQVVPGYERRLPETWALIARTYQLLKKGVDNDVKSGENPDSPSGDNPSTT